MFLWQPQSLAIRSLHNPPSHIFMYNARRIFCGLSLTYSFLFRTLADEIYHLYKQMLIFSLYDKF